MTRGVPLQWEQTNESWRGKRNGVVVAVVVPRASDGMAIWSMRTVNPFGVAPGAGTAATVDAAKEAVQSSWDAWCWALGLEASQPVDWQTVRAA